MKWFRLYHETCTDPKLRRVAHQAGTTMGHVLAVWVSMLSHASANQGGARGTLAGWDDVDCAINLGMDKVIVRAIRREMEGRMVMQDSIIAWQNRQYDSDSGATRMRAWREKKKQENQQPEPAVTSLSRHGDATVTAKSRGEEIRDTVGAKAPTPPKPRKRVSGDAPAQAFDRFWKAYPRKIGKGAALKAWPRAVQQAGGDPEAIIAGLVVQTSLARFDEREDGRFIPHPTTWLNGQRWLDGMDDAGEPDMLRRSA